MKCIMEVKKGQGKCEYPDYLFRNFWWYKVNYCSCIHKIIVTIVSHDLLQHFQKLLRCNLIIMQYYSFSGRVLVTQLFLVGKNLFLMHPEPIISV